MIKAVLFDLDGTLLPMDQDKFLNGYFGMLGAKVQSVGYDAAFFLRGIKLGTYAMITNDGKKTNEEAFWDAFHAHYADRAAPPVGVLDEFYENDFHKTAAFFGNTERSREMIDLCRKKGFLTALATNPVFPAIATRIRMGHVGLSPDDFALVTTYENSSFCKPNVAYFREVAEKLGVMPEECLMVGNDVSDDMPAREVGMQVFLLTDCLINAKGEELSQYPHGGFDELAAYIRNL
ncbi:MAG: HAD family hydrolase [Ruminococcaceae bacterium]|nr:HAD family hydrolase [Oscillospiraceae bacterium]